MRTEKEIRKEMETRAELMMEAAVSEATTESPLAYQVGKYLALKWVLEKAGT